MDIVTNHTADVIQLEGNAGYRNKRDFPYRDASGQPFDDSDFAYSGQPDYSFPEVNAGSFPYAATLPPDEADVKNPAWLNDPLLYHNRGNTSFTGENSLYGDFFGLDDLWTERREVVEGMVDIYSFWIDEFGVDGFRIDTTKHVNMEFWQKFGPDILAAAEARGIDDFFAFGEVFDQQFGPAFMSEFSTKGRLQSTIDFAFQLAARGFASQGAPTDALRDFFALDDYYTDADSNAYAMPTFLGNHDMGRIGYFLQRVDQAGAGDAELLARSRLAHALMFFARGQPVVYYGDEQGFVGDGGDKDAREDMFANAVPSYADNDLIGTDETSADDNFDRDHPLYDTIGELAKLSRQHPALRSGAQIHRVSSAGPGVYAFSRIDRDQRVEYVVALNNSEAAASAEVPTFSPAGAKYKLVSRKLAPSGSVPDTATTGPDGELSVTVPALGVVIYQANRPLPASDAAPGIAITSLEHGDTVALGTNSWDGHQVADRVEVAAELDQDAYAEVTFAVREGSGEYVPIGTDDNPPYRVFYDASHLRGHEDTKLSFRAIVNDLSGHLAADEVVNVGVEFPEAAAPETPYAVVHYARPAGDYGDHTTGNANDFWGLHLWGDAIAPEEATDWTTPKPFLGEDEYGRFAFVKLANDTLPVNFIVHRGDTKDPDNSPDRSFDPGATPEIWLRQGDVTIYTSQAEAQGHATVHYACTDCSGVTIDVTSAAGPVDDQRPARRNGRLRRSVHADATGPVVAADRHHPQRRDRRRRCPDLHADRDADGLVPARRAGGPPVPGGGGGLRHDPLPASGRATTATPPAPTSTTSGACTSGRARRPRPRGTIPLRPIGQDVFGIEFRDRPGRRGRPARLHPPSGQRRQGPGPRPVPRVRHLWPRGLAARGGRPGEALRGAARGHGRGPLTPACSSSSSTCRAWAMPPTWSGRRRPERRCCSTRSVTSPVISTSHGCRDCGSATPSTPTATTTTSRA